MESTLSGELNNFVNTTIINLNAQVLVNLFLYSAAVTSGVLFTSKIIALFFEEFLKLFRYKLQLKFKNRMEEIKELNRKMHDRLTEVEEAVKSNQLPTDKTRVRLLYNTSRLTKYDKTLVDDVYFLLNNWTVALSLYERDEITSGELSKSRADSLDVIKRIKFKIDKL